MVNLEFPRGIVIENIDMILVKYNSIDYVKLSRKQQISTIAFNLFIFCMISMITLLIDPLGFIKSSIGYVYHEIMMTSARDDLIINIYLTSVVHT